MGPTILGDEQEQSPAMPPAGKAKPQAKEVGKTPSSKSNPPPTNTTATVTTTTTAKLSTNLSEKLKSLIKVPKNNNNSKAPPHTLPLPLPESMLNKLQSLSLKAEPFSTLEDRDEADPAQHRCPHCSKSFISGKALDSHKAAKHKPSSGDGQTHGKIPGIPFYYDS